MVSNTLIEAATAEYPDEILLVLLAIKHDDLTTPIRLVADTVDLVSRGNTYTAFGFEFTLPSQGSGPPKITLSLPNMGTVDVDGEPFNPLHFLRTLTVAPTIDVEVVLRDTPDVVEVSFYDMILRALPYDALEFTAEISIDEFFSSAYPAKRFNPQDYPGIY